MEAAPTEHLILTGGVGYLHAKYDKYFQLNAAGGLDDLSSQPFSNPKWTYNLGATYRIPVDSEMVRIAANWAYTGTFNYRPIQPFRSMFPRPGTACWTARSAGPSIATGSRSPPS